MGFQGLAGFGGGATGLAQAGGAAAFDATGGTLYTPGNGYNYHTFIGPGTFVVASGAGNVEVILVAGGGGAAPGYNSGAGGGGVVYHQQLAVTPTTYSISIGGGGAGSN